MTKGYKAVTEFTTHKTVRVNNDFLKIMKYKKLGFSGTVNCALAKYLPGATVNCTVATENTKNVLIGMLRVNAKLAAGQPLTEEDCEMVDACKEEYLRISNDLKQVNIDTESVMEGTVHAK